MMDLQNKFMKEYSPVSSNVKLELLSLLVIAFSLVVFAIQRNPASVFAASLQSGILRMNGGEQVRLVCNGSALNISNLSITQAMANCLAVMVSPTSTPQPTTTPSTLLPKITFDNKTVGSLTGEYPAGQVTWDGSSWEVSPAWEKLTSRSLAFRSSSITQGSLSFPQSTSIVSVVAYNGGSQTSTVSITCGSQTKSQDVVAGANPVTIYTNFMGTCRTATIRSSNAWDTNFDDLALSVGGGVSGGGSGGTPVSTSMPGMPTSTPTIPPSPQSGGGSMSGMSMAMMAWSNTGKNKPHATYDKCDDGTNIVTAHNAYYVTAYDGLSYPTWHPSVANNPITGNGKCYFGHEHGRNPADYQYYGEIASHFGRDMNGDGQITAMRVSSVGVITAGDRAGLPFGMANEKMDQYYNQEGRDSIFVRHEDHVGHKVEFVNGEADMVNHSTHVMGNNTTGGVNIPYGASDNYSATGVRCAQLHKIHQGVSTPDAIRNNLHELIIHSTCASTNSAYRTNTIIATGMIPYGRPGEYRRFCAGGNMPDDRYAYVCADGGTSPNCSLNNDPLISKLPADRLSSASLGRNMVDRVCLNKVDARGEGTYFNPYEIWEGSLEILKPNGSLIARIGRQWEVLDPVRYVDSSKPNGIGYNSLECDGLLKGSTQRCDRGNKPWDSRESGFKGLARSMYIARNHANNSGGPEVVWTDPLGGNATTSSFSSGLKQKVSSVNADFANIQLPSGTSLNDRSIKRDFDDEGNNSTVHAPN